MSQTQISLAFAAILVAFAFAATAKTTTWTGGATYLDGKIAKSFNDPNNWDNGVPAPGDTVVISCASGWNNPVYIGIENGSTDTVENFDLGSAGLTFDISSSYTLFLVNFSGSGKIVKTGGGKLGFDCDSSFTGGIEVRQGALEVWKSGLTLGTAPIEMTTDYGYTPTFNADAWGVGVANAIYITGSTSYKILSSGQLFTFGGELVIQHDTTFEGTYGGINFNGDVTATGHTLTVRGNRTVDEKNPPHITFAGKVDASIVKTGNKNLKLNGVTTNPDNVLTISEGGCEIGNSGSWGGTNIVVSSGQTLTVNNEDSLSPEAVVKLTNGSKLVIPSGVVLMIGELYVGGAAVDAGVYTALDLPEALSGTGVLVVRRGNGKTAGYSVWIGPTGDTAASFSASANWQDGIVPQPGGLVRFPANGYVTLADETFDFGARGLYIVNEITNWQGLECAVKFSGSGKLVVDGPGAFSIRNDSLHTGGTELRWGNLRAWNRYKTFRFGTGSVVLTTAAGHAPTVISAEWDCGILNDIVFGGDYSNKTTFECGNPCAFSNVTATSAMKLYSRYGNMTFRGNFDLGGEELTVEACDPTNPTYPGKIFFMGAVNASVKRIGNHYTEFSGVSDYPDNGYLQTDGTNAFTSAARWGGTNLVLSGSATQLKLQGDRNLSEAATLRLSSGAKVDIATGVKAHVGRLFVDDVEKGPGVYSAARLPGALTGGGLLKVGESGVVIIFR